MLTDTSGNARQFGFGACSINDDMAMNIGQRNEIAFRIDNALLHPLGALLKQAAKEMRFA